MQDEVRGELKAAGYVASSGNTPTKEIEHSGMSRYWSSKETQTALCVCGLHKFLCCVVVCSWVADVCVCKSTGAFTLWSGQLATYLAVLQILEGCHYWRLLLKKPCVFIPQLPLDPLGTPSLPQVLHDLHPDSIPCSKCRGQVLYSDAGVAL